MEMMERLTEAQQQNQWELRKQVYILNNICDEIIDQLKRYLALPPMPDPFVLEQLEKKLKHILDLRNQMWAGNYDPFAGPKFW